MTYPPRSQFPLGYPVFLALFAAVNLALTATLALGPGLLATAPWLLPALAVGWAGLAVLTALLFVRLAILARLRHRRQRQPGRPGLRQSAGYGPGSRHRSQHPPAPVLHHRKKRSVYHSRLFPGI